MPEFPMVRNHNDEWPDDAPPGTFDITGTGPNRHLFYVCPNGKRCGVFVSSQRQDAESKTWKWDGDENAPTLSPSINCEGGCGWHGHIEKGVMRG